ncbi:outer dynein arm-docking complex subunit 3-like [Corythoichthys intestinalis]|uniref:outer dynein arm-docking complex subunit 3-like n=1 Tax=Corythoichthys intestinalis TaxID=161448 RepID=UPI0025A4DE34|nr:outer dynein arm-docking complex subunit 3-like [Corythoichthys intestinalis]XP_061802349.1 outer dynein arm-docking complex subunit 3-like [Nerophis lumbriciformis]
MFESENTKSWVHDQIAELQRKLQLLESDMSASYENSRSALERNQQHILQLQEENRELKKRVSDAEAEEQQFIQSALHGRGMEKDTGPSVSGKAALSKLEHRVASKMKRLNALKHTTLTHQRRLEDLKRECLRLEAVGCNQAISEKEEITMKLRSLQTCLEKNQLKCKEAANIMTNYLKLKRQLQEENPTFQGQIDSQEAEIQKYRKELQEVQDMNNKAQLLKETAIAELQELEEVFFKEHQEKDYLLAVYRKRVQEIKARAEKIDAQRKNVQQDELNTEAEAGAAKMSEEMEQSISVFDETIQIMKEATGCSDTQEVMDRFNTQRETHRHVQAMKSENEYVLQQLREQKVQLMEELDNMKYSGETQLSSEQKKLEECEQELVVRQQNCEKAKECLSSLVATLSTIQAGVEHLAEKLSPISLNEPPSNVSPNSEEFGVVLLNQCERKVQLLKSKLHGKDLEEITKDMEEEEFYFTIEKQLPTYNKRVVVTEDQEMGLITNEDDNEEDDGILTREALKRRSQLVIDAMSNKKSWKGKKGK